MEKFEIHGLNLEQGSLITTEINRFNGKIPTKNETIRISYGIQIFANKIVEL